MSSSAVRPTAFLRVDPGLLDRGIVAGTPSPEAADESPTWCEFHDPIEVLEAHDLQDVPRVLREVEQRAAEGKWCVGYVAYEAAPAFDPALTTRAPAATVLSTCDSALADPDPLKRIPLVRFSIHDRADPADAPTVRSENEVSTRPILLPSRDGYVRCLQRIHEEIADGNTYQVNFTVQLTAGLTGSAQQLFAELYRRQPTEFAAYLDLGAHAVVSVSPELFFERRGTTVTMRPMKGTVARGETAEQDDANKRWLLGSAKNRAENTMIVDLLRNDLGQIARTGTVRVEKLVRLETYPTFHALTSTVTAETPGATLAEVFGALFPCGSITGAPKPSTMRIIAELESEPRGVYCGAIGVVAPGGDARFSVAIRTAVVARTQHHASSAHTADGTHAADGAPTAGGTHTADDEGSAFVQYGVGGGITADSGAAEEYAELLVKSRILLDLPGPDLLETFRVQDGEAVNLELHLARMRTSAIALGYNLDEPALQATIRDLEASHGPGTWRARLLLTRAGQLRAEAAPFDVNPAAVMTARIGDDPVDSTDVRLRHKLSDRTLYDARRDPLVDTTLLVNERGEVTEFLFGNIVVRRDGGLYTPPLSSGLLPGVGRALAIQNGVEEQLIRSDELAHCEEVWHVNSLRGWTRVKLELPRVAG